MLNRKEIENYLLDFEIVTAAYPSIAFEDYEKIVPDANASDVKELVSQVMSLCTGGGNISKRDFLINLAKKVTPETKIYAEFQTAIF